MPSFLSRRVNSATPLHLEKGDYLRFGVALGLGLLISTGYGVWLFIGSETCKDLPGGGFECTAGGDNFPINQLILASMLAEAAAFAILAFKKGRGLAWIGFKRIRVLPAAQFILLGIVFLVALDGVLALAGHYLGGVWAEQQFTGLPIRDKTFGILFLTLAALIAPVFEETIFRGILFRVLWGRFGLMAGAIISSIGFGLLHMPLPATIGTFCIGLYLCFLYKRTGSIIPGIILHSLNNTVGVVLLLMDKG